MKMKQRSILNIEVNFSNSDDTDKERTVVILEEKRELDLALLIYVPPPQHFP